MSSIRYRVAAETDDDDLRRQWTRSHAHCVVASERFDSANISGLNSLCMKNAREDLNCGRKGGYPCVKRTPFRPRDQAMTRQSGRGSTF